MSISSQKALAELRVGKVYGNVTVIKRIGTNAQRGAVYLCVCFCGAYTEKSSRALNNPKVCCGCTVKSRQSNSHIVHGHSKRSGTTQAYRAWQSIFARCNRISSKSYKYYGAKGIQVSPAWETFEAFFADMGNPPGESYELDRINPNGNYEVGNCRWITKQENIARVVHNRNKLGMFTI
jgi:hypothetical protein